MRIAVAQLNYTLGDFSGNFAKISDAIQKMATDADLIIFSELCLSGYYPRDLIYQPGFIELQNSYLQKIQLLAQQHHIAIIIGYIEKNLTQGKPFYNSLCLLMPEAPPYHYQKQLLPVYNIFDEARHFASGKHKGVYTYQNIKMGFIICEDGWAGADDYLYACDPVNELMQENLDIIISINGSPSNIGKQAERIQHFSSIAKRCQAPLVFVNQIGANDDIVFDGASFLIDHLGNVQASLASFEEAVGVFSLENKQLSSILHFKHFTPLNNMALFYHQTILGIKDYAQKCGFKKVVIGISGGIDSALTLALAVKALGSENVVGLSMPSRYSSTHSQTDAQALCDNFKVKLYTASIEPEFTVALAEFEKVFKEKPLSLTSQNIQARIRGRILMEYSNQTGALVLSTGNKSELSVGYTTLYGDMTGGLNPIGDLYKTDVYALCTYFNQLHPDTLIPEAIIHKAPSAELDFDQKDSDSLPEYAILDPILRSYLEGDLLPEAESIANAKLLASIPQDIIRKVHRMVNLAEFKRKQSPPIIRVQRRAFGHGRQYPITGRFPVGY